MKTESEEEKNYIISRRTLLLALAAVFFLAAIIFTGYELLHVKVTGTVYEYELGERMELEPGYYLNAGPLAGKLAHADFSTVDSTRPGTYTMNIRYLLKDYAFEIRITDSVAPQITLLDGPLFFEKGTKIRPSDLVRSVMDADRHVTVTLINGSLETDTVSCDKLGARSILIRAEDSSGNRSECTAGYVVDLPPQLVNVRDYYVAAGSSENLLGFISAVDLMDGDLTDSVTISEDVSTLEPETDTIVTLSVTDSCGFRTSAEVMVHVETPETIQELIGNGDISRADHHIIGALNVYDTGLFRDQEIEDTLIDVMPTVISVRVDEKNGNIITGSGYIIDISDSYVYILTNKHVVKNFTECEIFFYTGTSAPGKVIGCDEDYDIAVIKVSLYDLPDSFTDFISTVHIDLTYWDDLSDEKIKLGLERLETNGTISHYTYGTLVKKLQNFPFFAPHVQTEMALPLMLGDSGSAVFDSEGRLIGMAFAYSIAPERDWAIPLDEIVEAYEEISGRDLYTY
ncbi:MAG: hypothetical protein K5871_07735 [Lachnospiraceae bacterium]|nr:hypothetical protein [Lachnospiraceae bacterium]